MNDSQRIDNSLSSFETEPVTYIHPSRVGEWLPDIPSAAANLLSQSRRLRIVLSHRIQKHYALEPIRITPDVPDLQIATADGAKLQRIISLAGAIWHGHSLKKVVSRDTLIEILGDLNESDYRTAVTQAPLLAAQEEADFSDRESINRDGNLCFRAWLAVLPEAVSRRVALKFPENPIPVELSSLHVNHGPQVFRIAGEKVLSA